MATCNSCGKPIVWAHTVGGKRMPVDAVASELGNIILMQNGMLYAVVERKGMKQLWGRDVPPERYTSHFATCPNAAQHRKGR